MLWQYKLGVLREQAQADGEKEDGYAQREGEVKRVIEAWQHLKTWQVLKVEKRNFALLKLVVVGQQ